MVFYYAPGSRKMSGQRITFADRLRMRKARKRREKLWRPYI